VDTRKVRITGNPIVINTGNGGAAQLVFTIMFNPSQPSSPAGGGASIREGAVGLELGSTTTRQAPLGAPPVARFAYRVLANRIVHFTSTSLNSPTLLLWDFDDGHTASSVSPYHQFASANTYTVKLTAQNRGGIGTVSQELVVETLAFYADFTYQVGGYTAYFTNTSTVEGTPSWTFSDGTTSSDENPTKTFPGNGSHWARLTIGSFYEEKTIVIDTEILLTWQDNSGNEDGFKIEHSLDGVEWTQLATVGAGITTYGVTQAVDGVDSDVLNYFRVRAYNDAGDSDYANVESIQCGA